MPQQGGDLPYFVGKQYGSGWLRAIGRFAFPILRKLGIMAANTAKDVLINEKPILPSLKENAMKTANSVIPGLFTEEGEGISKTSRKRKSSSKQSINKRRRMHGTIFR
jgi:hypothetical protein